MSLLFGATAILIQGHALGIWRIGMSFTTS
jgi:hypothetical protein